MLRLFWIVLFGLGSEVVSSFPARDENSLQCAPSRQKKASTPVKWQTYMSPQGRFSIQFPDSPKNVIYQKIEQGNDPALHFYVLNTQPIEGVVLTVNYFDVPVPEKMPLKYRYLFLEESWKSYYGRIKNQSIYKRRMTQYGHPAIEHRLRNPKDAKYIITGRYVFVKNRIYHVFAAMKEPEVKAGHAARFLNSFKPL